MNIGFIPIDNRPVCYQQAKIIAELDNHNKIFLPQIELLGNLTDYANIEGIIDWLKSLKNIDKLIVSLDTIAYGGLISSRRSNDEFNIIKKRIDDFFKIIKENKIEVYAFSSIMRISNNNINEEEKEYWSEFGEKIFQYSFKKHQAEKNNIIFENTEIPKEILDDYLKTRKRNFEINKYYIELKKQNLIDTLVFSKDDCSKFGLNIKESEELYKLSQETENIIIKTGADEIPLSLLSRALNKDKMIKIAPIYLNKNSIDKISKYEDISVKKSVEEQIKLCGGIISETQKADLILIVNNFEKEQGELVMNIDVPLFNGEIELPKKPYFIADILNANGSDNNFVDKFLEKIELDNFYGYAAWNTTGNTLGSAISTAMTYYKSKEPNKGNFIKLQTIRFLDDWAYQANVRKEIRDNNKNLRNNIVKQKMANYEKIILNKLNIQKKEIEYSFPWNRFFEIEIDIK